MFKLAKLLLCVRRDIIFLPKKQLEPFHFAKYNQHLYPQHLFYPQIAHT